MGRLKRKRNSTVHIWSADEKRYLTEITPGHHYTEIQELVNQKFKLDLTLNQIKGAVSRYRLNTGFTGRFEKGHIPVNKGLKGVCAKGCEKTWFKKGQLPINHKKVGSERISKDGYIEIKIAEPSKWRLKHLVIWEKENEPVPKGHALVFADGNKTNLNMDNLILVTRHQLLIMNKNKLIKNDAESTKTGALIANVIIKANERGKKAQVV